MKQVWKYNLSNGDKIIMPLGAKILTVAEQNSDICLWVMVNPDEDRAEERQFGVFGTGHDIADNLDLNYLGTVQLNGGALVFHVFEYL